MSNRPIEPGCLAIILAASAPEIVGKSCTVVRRQRGSFVNHEGEIVDGDGWWVLDVPGEYMPCCRPASSLLRIDDHGEDADDYEVIREEWGITA